CEAASSRDVLLMFANPRRESDAQFGGGRAFVATGKLYDRGLLARPHDKLEPLGVALVVLDHVRVLRVGSVLGSTGLSEQRRAPGAQRLNARASFRRERFVRCGPLVLCRPHALGTSPARGPHVRPLRACNVRLSFGASSIAKMRRSAYGGRPRADL